ncbi:helix-turn-helix domain-containing protein [Paenibacillus glufosinatiresistens]|uniref:helix-turn-helix domain-containing protein n=1 Tax=Paenibacillus glufosinatiresistens TaxID=3070657 RepID=UPI00286E45B3|nr:helix-turn-helix transcriptional regulator [Paenibacillus sp. YX.27]
MTKRLITPLEYHHLKENPLGGRIRFFREETGKLSQKEMFSTRAISKRIGVSAPSITAIERGESKNPSFQLVTGMARELNLPIEVFTDEFYGEELKLFEIGISDDIKSTVTTQEQADPSLASNFQFGCYVYQLFHDGSMRFVYSKGATNPVDYAAFIESLSRFVTEIELHSIEGGILNASEYGLPPIQHAAALFRACIEHPDAFPLFPIKEWNQFYSDFLSKYEQKEEKRHEQA